ncbi:MAG: cellobiose phosphorylase [Candidatus Omnitrophica bacterium]|nr:cellobiose phosphorylase [Candidatus Omnitrophota bacterium]
MKNYLWKFTDNQGTFYSDNAQRINSLYFPLCNSSPIMSSVTGDLHGDIKTNFNSFLLQPASRIDLNNLKSSRNFWIYLNPKKIWSASGVSKDIATIKNDDFRLEAGLLWQKITRKNKKTGLKAEITSFIPASLEPIEIMYVEITNISSKTVQFIPTAAIPIYGRSCNNLHDHRHVTSLLNRIQKDEFGVIVTPTLSFDESGHKKGNTSYFVFGLDEKSVGPEYIYPTQEEFIGDGSDLEAPVVIYNNLLPDRMSNIQGKEAMGALRFKEKALRPKEYTCFIVLLGITQDKKKIKSIFNRFNSPAKVRRSLETTKYFWQKKSAQILVHSTEGDFDNWFGWVNIQPELRRIFGCSFLPDFDYGKGGRGWRDLWQDCLHLALTNPKEARSLLINNFAGVRIDGSNATIIGQARVEFIADRNNISRVWMDHGIWPLFTAHLYIHQSGDLKILLEKTSYFRDPQLSRAKEKDLSWNPAYGQKLKDRSKKIYKGTILEHLLVQNLIQFFNVGPHNHIRLENADWNDGLDMAYQNGESVTFTAMYGKNLMSLCEIIERLKQKNIVIFKELRILLDSLSNAPINYDSLKEKQRLLGKYFEAVKYEVSGEKVTVEASKLVYDLKKKAEWITRHIQKTEWLKSGFFNGYYNNNKQRVEGMINGAIRMTLVSQTFPIMSGVATEGQVKIILKNVKKYLQDKKLGGFHLNTDFKSEQLSLGRAFSFVYGDKENGAFFNHMAVMFAYCLYARGFAKEGHEVINSIYNMSCDTEKSKIYPCLPEYFNAEGRGMYSYLTGSASWFILTVLTQIFGIRGEYGDLVIEPKLVSDEFKTKKTISITTSFAQRRIEVRFINPSKKDFGKYSISKIILNGRVVAKDLNRGRFVILRDRLLSLTNNNYNVIEVILD